MKIPTKFKLDKPEPLVYHPCENVDKELIAFIKENSKTFTFEIDTKTVHLVNKFCEMLDYLNVNYEREDGFDGLVHLTCIDKIPLKEVNNGIKRYKRLNIIDASNFPKV